MVPEVGLETLAGHFLQQRRTFLALPPLDGIALVIWFDLIGGMGSMGSVKTTLDIHDALLVRAKRHAQKVGRPLRAVVEEGLQHVLSAVPSGQEYKLPDWSYGDASGRDPLESLSWQDLREMTYGGPETR